MTLSLPTMNMMKLIKSTSIVIKSISKIMLGAYSNTYQQLYGQSIEQ